MLWLVLKQILKQRDDYDSIAKYSEENPLFSTLLEIFENNGVTSRKHMLEAMLVTGEDFETIAKKLNDPVIPDGLVVGLYHELFYNIRPYLDSTPSMYRYIVQPLMQCNGLSMPIGELWKLLAYVGGMDVLEASGFGTRPLSAEDLAYLVQLGGYRNAAMMLKYIADGDSFAKDNPIAANIVMGLAELSKQTAHDVRDTLGFKKLENANVQDYSHALTGLFHMVYENTTPVPVTNDIEDRLITCKPTKIDTDDGTN